MDAGSRRTPDRAAIAVAVVLGGIVVVVLAAVAIGDGIRLRTIARDPVTTTGGPAHLGLLTTMSAIVWSATVAVAALGSFVVVEPVRRRFLWSAAFVTTLLALDDLFLLHERGAPAVGIPEEVLFVTYGVAFLGHIRVHRPVLATTSWWILGVSVFVFSMSLIDAFSPFRFPTVMASDTYTFIGVSVWFVFHLHTVLTWIDAGRRPFDRTE